MKKVVRMFINVIICISVLLSLVSCNLLDAINDFLNRNDDGPGSAWHHVYQLMWVETYDEMLEIVERTRAYGTEIPQIPAFDCEEYGLDIKFAIQVENDIFDELEDKDEYFDRKINQFLVICYVFFESVTIDELDITCYSLFWLNCGYIPSVYMSGNKVQYFIGNSEDNENIKIESEAYSNTNETRIKYSVKYKGKHQFYLVSDYEEFEITEEQIEILEKTLTIIE